MNRCLALIGALFFAFLSVSSACAAAPAEWVHFSLDQQRRGGDRTPATFRWSTGFRPSEFVGLDPAGLRYGGTHPLRFALI